MSETVSAAQRRVDAIFQSRYRTTLADVDITDTPGYWKRREPCGGRGACREPIHGTLFNEGGIRHTLSYFDPVRDEYGRFRSTTRTWSVLRGADPTLS